MKNHSCSSGGIQLADTPTWKSFGRKFRSLTPAGYGLDRGSKAAATVDSVTATRPTGPIATLGSLPTVKFRLALLSAIAATTRHAFARIICSLGLSSTISKTWLRRDVTEGTSRQSSHVGAGSRHAGEAIRTPKQTSIAGKTVLGSVRRVTAKGLGDSWLSSRAFRAVVTDDGAKGSPPSLFGDPVVSPAGSPLKLLRREVSRLENNAEHLLSGAAVLLRFLAESVKQLTFNANGSPVLRGANLLFLLVHLHTYTLSGQLFHQYSVILSDYLKLSKSISV